MNALECPVSSNEASSHVGLYRRALDDWWRVSEFEREFMYRIEHGGANGRVNIDTVVDLDNLRAKLQKWHCEGFVRDDEAHTSTPPHRDDFMMRLRRAVAAQAGQAAPAVQASSVTIADTSIAKGAGGPFVPAINPAYLFTARANDIVENQRVMLIGHTGAGKTSLIEQIAARAEHGVLRSNMNG